VKSWNQVPYTPLLHTIGLVRSSVHNFVRGKYLTLNCAFFFYSKDPQNHRSRSRILTTYARDLRVRHHRSGRRARQHVPSRKNGGALISNTFCDQKKKKTGFPLQPPQLRCDPQCVYVCMCVCVYVCMCVCVYVCIVRETLTPFKKLKCVSVS